MKKTRFLAAMLVSTVMHSTAQTYDTTQYSGKMNYIFQYVNKAPITTNILRDVSHRATPYCLRVLELSFLLDEQ